MVYPCWIEANVTPTLLPTAVRYNGKALGFLTGSRKHITLGDGLNSIGIETWYTLVPDPGVHDVEVDYSGSVDSYCGAMSFFNVAHDVPLGAPVTANAQTGSPTANVASAGDDLVSAAAFGVVIAALTAQDIEVWSTGVAGSLESSGAVQVGAPTVTMDWTGLNGAPYEWVETGVSIKPWVVQTMGQRLVEPLGAGFKSKIRSIKSWF